MSQQNQLSGKNKQYSQIMLKLDQQREQFLQCQKFIQKQQLELYYSVLKFSGLKVRQQIDIRNVAIYQKDYIHEIYTKNQQRQDLPHLLFIHGFGGTALIYNRVIGLVAKDYRVHSIDILGNAYSSRANWSDDFTAQQVQNYHIKAIQQWRKSSNIKSFVLAGHSFGAYLSSRYAKIYPERIQRLILLSPAGFRIKQQSQWGHMTFCQKINHKIGGWVFQTQKNPTQSYRFLYGCLLDKITGQTLNLKGKQQQVWKQYLKNISKQKHTSERGFYTLFDWPSIPQLGTIENLLKQQKFAFQVQVYYGEGDKDWIQMVERAADKIPKTFKKEYVHCEMIPGGTHQLLGTVPNQVAQKILRKLL